MYFEPGSIFFPTKEDAARNKWGKPGFVSKASPPSLGPLSPSNHVRRKRRGGRGKKRPSAAPKGGKRGLVREGGREASNEEGEIRRKSPI